MVAKGYGAGFRQSWRGALRSVLAFALALTLTLPGVAGACTLWSAVGEAAGGGTITAKIRDYAPDSYGKLVLVRPENGLAYLGYFARIKGRERLAAGVNEAGFTAVSATAGSVPRKDRDVPSTVKALLDRLLSTCRNVDEALIRREWFSGHAPVNYLFSDERSSAWAEVGPGGKVAFKRADAGALAHANHYLAPQLLEFNVKDGPSSQARLSRITELLSQGKSFTLDDFERFSADRVAGPDNSLFRTGSGPKSTRTMAVFLTRTEPGRPILAVVKGFDDPAAPWTERLTLDRAFFEQIPPGSMKTIRQGMP